ncbi:nitroreductase family protein [Candidatus Sumerlaeota bacterium]|nr:nitroreductase family protein [Candidatus Sumerlaeota bacterium]
MDIFEAIEKRHSYRGGFQENPIPREALRKIVEAGLKAPSGRNAQTTEFVIVDDPEILGKIRSMNAKSRAMQQAVAYMACLVDKNACAVYEGHSFQVEDCSAAVENMLLAITALGYATVWVDGWLRLEGRAGKIGELLGVPEEKIVRVILPIGIPKEEITGPDKKPFEERAWFNRYGC